MLKDNLALVALLGSGRHGELTLVGKSLSSGRAVPTALALGLGLPELSPREVLVAVRDGGPRAAVHQNDGLAVLGRRQFNLALLDGRADLFQSARRSLACPASCFLHSVSFAMAVAILQI